jgi:hypothetical protein
MKEINRTWIMENEREFGELVDTRTVFAHEMLLKDERATFWENHQRKLRSIKS